MTNSVGSDNDTVIELARLPAAQPGGNAPDPKDTVALAHAEMEASGTSRNQAAREIGVSSTRLSKWLRGIYEGDVPAVTALVAAWLETRAEARRRDLTPAGLDRHVALNTTRDIQAALSHAQAVGDVVLIHGPSGRGKTWAAKHHCAGRAGAVFLSITGACVTLSGLLHRLSDAAGAGGRHGSALEAETAIVSRLADRGALIVIDEAHHLRASQIDELRCIRDMAACGLALIGDDSVRMTLARCPQVMGRTGMRVDLRSLGDGDVADIAAGPLGRRPRAAEMKVLSATARGPGGLHALRRLMARAWMLARAEGRDSIVGDDIAAAAEDGAPC